MKKYKYKIGQKVKYNTQKYTETVCPTCGHEETDSKTIKVEGKIMKRYYDLVIRFQSMAVKEEPVYEVKRNSQPKERANEIVTEDQIIKTD